MASNLRRFFLQTDELAEPMVPFVVPIETKYMSTSSNRGLLAFQNMPSHMKDVVYVFCYLCHKFDGKIYMVYNEPFLSMEQGSVLNPHQRAMVSTSVSFVFLMNRKKLCETQELSDLDLGNNGAGGESSTTVPFWLNNADSCSRGAPDGSNNNQFSLAHYDGSMPFGSNLSTDGTNGGQGDEYFLPTQAHRRLADAILDLLAVKMGIASFAHIMSAEIKPAVRQKIDFYMWKAEGVQKTDVKNMGGTMYLSGGVSGGFGMGSAQSNRGSLPGFSCNNLDELIDAFDTFISKNARTTSAGRVKIGVSRRTVCDPNTALWFKLKHFLAMHVWDAPTFRRYMIETIERFVTTTMQVDSVDNQWLKTNKHKKMRELEKLSELKPLFERGTIRFMREISSSNQIKRITATKPVDVVAFEYKAYELLRNGVLDGTLQDVPHLDTNNFEIQMAVKQRYNIDVSPGMMDSSFETYASIITDYNVVESIQREAATTSHIYNSNSPVYMSTMWPHLYFISAVVSTRAMAMQKTSIDYMRLRNEVPMLDSVWSLGLNKASTIMNKLFTMYKKRINATSGGNNYTEAMAYDARSIESMTRWRCRDPPVAAYASLIVKLFGSHVSVSRFLQAELLFKLVVSATAPRWRTARCMMVNYTPTAHKKSLCNHIVSLMFKNIDGLILKKTSFTPASLKYKSETDVEAAGCTVIFDDTTVAGVSCNKTASEEDSNMSAMIKNILDCGITVSNIAGTSNASKGTNISGDFRSKTITTVHNVQWVWNVNTISTFSSAVKDRCMMVMQQQMSRESLEKLSLANSATLIDQAEVYGDRLDELTITEARLQPLAENWITRLHVHLSLISVFGPHLLAPAPDERSFLYGLLTHHLKNVFHLADEHRKDANRQIDKVTDIFSLLAHAMGTFHTLDTAVMPYVPLRYPKRGERLSDYLSQMRKRAHKAYAFRTREDTMLDTVCGAILYTGPALLDTFSQVVVPNQAMHLSAMSAIITYVKSHRLFQWTLSPERVSFQIPYGVLHSFYVFDVNCAQLMDLKACMLGQDKLVESIVVHRAESGSGGSQGTGNGSGIESFSFDFKTKSFYSLAAYLFSDEYRDFSEWYDTYSTRLEEDDEECASKRELTLDASSAQYFRIMFAQLRQALGYGIRFQPQERTGEHTFTFKGPCKFWWFKYAKAAARDALKKSIGIANNKMDKSGFLEVDSDFVRDARFTLPYSIHDVNKESNLKRTDNTLHIHWKCLTSELLSQLELDDDEELVIEDNYMVVPDNSVNSRATESLSAGKTKTLGKRFKTTNGEVLLWEPRRISLLTAFVDPIIKPAKVFSSSVLSESGFAHYCYPKTFSYTSDEQKTLVVLDEDEKVRHKSHVVFRHDPSRQNTNTFKMISEGFYELKQDWEFAKMAELFHSATGREDVTPEDMKEWHTMHWPTGVVDAPSNYSEFCREMKSDVNLDDEMASAHFPESHPIFSRMRRFFDSPASERWLNGAEAVDWNTVANKVKAHYNHNSIKETTQSPQKDSSQLLFEITPDLDDELDDELDDNEEEECSLKRRLAEVEAEDDDDEEEEEPPSKKKQKITSTTSDSFADQFLSDL